AMIAPDPREQTHMTMVDDINDALDLEPAGGGQFRAKSLRDIGEGDVVFGGQFLAQIAMAAASIDPAKSLKYVSAVFGRPAVRQDLMDIEVEAMHGGRSFATASVTVRQAGRLCARGIALLSSEEPDVIRHATPMPPVDKPADCLLFDGSRLGSDAKITAGREMRAVGGFNPGDPNQVRDPVLRVWARGPNLDSNPIKRQAFVAFVSAGPNISIAMLPHEGRGTHM